MKQSLRCPLRPAQLDRYRFRAGHRRRPDLVGGHLMRRKGAGLEFYEFTPYMPGDDIRRIDWKATARDGDEDTLLMRRFASEERTTLVISFDPHPSMRFPEELPKLQIALWLAEALTYVGRRVGDRVVLHRLFGPSANGVLDWQSSGTSGLARRLGAMARLEDEAPAFNGGPLQRYLRPASIWIIITDTYFDKEGEATRALARAMTAAQAGLRWLIVVDLDSWPLESARLGTGDRRLDGPEAPDRALDISAENLARVAMRIEMEKGRFRTLVSRSACDFTSWRWPNEPGETAADFFCHSFLEDRLLSRVFMREA